jgi:putative transposase
MTPEDDDRQATPLSQAEFQHLRHEKLRQAVRVTLINILEEEAGSSVNAPRYLRSVERRDRRNGHYPRDLGNSAGTITDLPVPRTRRGFHTQVLGRYELRQAALDQAIG